MAVVGTNRYARIVAQFSLRQLVIWEKSWETANHGSSSAQLKSTDRNIIPGVNCSHSGYPACLFLLFCQIRLEGSKAFLRLLLVVARDTRI